ncbi:MBL fold metallo-hydrolase [Mucilaginibacter antarcticus]|uniref:MBL fold metallo-hydrolase n=1 Tax=Mucilaginibacter antarcticus TaxID=1855725 RepID=UPI00363B8463
MFVNVYFVTQNSHWVLIDAGLPGSASKIKQIAADLFGNTPPSAILLTHGHFDHRGALKDLLKTWNVPVYAHKLELPYLTGKAAYPPADPTVGGGLMTLLSVLYPRKAINVPDIQALPHDGSTPFLPGWRTVVTPGHSPGHVSYFREADTVLIAGDAFVTTRQESAIATFSNLKEVNGPPRYFTPDWDAARSSVLRLRDLEPSVAATGHGPVMAGAQLKSGLQNLAWYFDETARPQNGRYSKLPAKTDNEGVTYIPPAPSRPYALASAVLLAALSAYTLVKRYRQTSL